MEQGSHVEEWEDMVLEGVVTLLPLHNPFLTLSLSFCILNVFPFVGGWGTFPRADPVYNVGTAKRPHYSITIHEPSPGAYVHDCLQAN